ncbi:MAG: BACON domain-containing protein, partial [Bacteroidaceae bacterium]|nr:BACON domain-containing protein [Bacteroidaceae bacterium]
MKHNRLYVYILAAIALVTYSSCKDGNAWGDDYLPSLSLMEDVSPMESSYLSLSVNTLSFTSEASSQTVVVNTNVSFGASASDSWVTVSPTSGKGKTELKVSVTKNTSTTTRAASARTANITISGGGLTKMIQVTQEGEEDNISSEPEAVDLGLPSGTKWANMNVGASSPEDYGLFFAWGETVGYGSDTSDGHSFDWASYKYCKGTVDSMTKYCTDSGHGLVDNKITLDLSDDAAYVNWGSSWRMPTIDEIQELMDNTTNTWTSVNGVYGRRFTSKTNSNSIFLPAAGMRGSSIGEQGSHGYYLSLSLDTWGSYNAGGVTFDSDNVNINWIFRYFGQCVRPVLNSDYLTVSPHELIFASDASSQTVTVSTTASWAYTISSSAEWLTATASSDRKTLTVSVAGNTTTSSRTGTITLAVSGLTATIAVTQQAGEAYLTVSPNELGFGSAASSETVTVSTNVSTAYTISSSAEW